MSSISMQKFDLEALHWWSSTDRQSTWPRPFFFAFLEIFSHLMLTILHGNYWQCLWRLSTCWSTSIQAYWLQRIVGYRENLLMPQLWTGRRQLFHISLCLLSVSLIHPFCQLQWVFTELWSQQELVTEDCFTYSRLGPGTGQVHRTG